MQYDYFDTFSMLQRLDSEKHKKNHDLAIYSTKFKESSVMLKGKFFDTIRKRPSVPHVHRHILSNGASFNDRDEQPNLFLNPESEISKLKTQCMSRTKFNHLRNSRNNFPQLEKLITHIKYRYQVLSHLKSQDEIQRPEEYLIVERAKNTINEKPKEVSCPITNVRPKLQASPSKASQSEDYQFDERSVKCRKTTLLFV